MIGGGSILLFALLATGGCNHAGSSSSSSSGTLSAAAVPITAPPLPTTARILKESRPPINYAIGPGGYVRFRDLTTNQELAAGSVLPNTVIRAEADIGVYFGSRIVFADHLNPNHRYQLSLDTTVPAAP